MAKNTGEENFKIIFNMAKNYYNFQKNAFIIKS